MRALMYRAWITCINIFFPPLAVAMLCGWEWDCMLNCFLFLLAVIPSHVHGFYVSCTYFHRRHKVKKGRWPGGPKSLIHSSNVINGGASDAEAARLWRKENGVDEKDGRRSRNSSMRRSGSQRADVEKSGGSDVRRRASSRDNAYQVNGGGRTGSQLGRAGTHASQLSGHGYRPGAHGTRAEEHALRDGYGSMR
ncbi:hypothetical protein LTR53_001715 [Teratosphaeriaceae sp. CCFEE 6253]|nr:hypothetical protein LTR53_001715 [Teratosphaeriaceae sp. CCFEE 6253]